ncbi:hypothetical protein DSL92_05525 [Billgrantia gudaonensis]|uniref:Uncharacterized protein n=1 Tax=Billgrantia gudaonensis TaxID=376427 RepID=A0A3S0QRS3_9GAMM|nr:hypothetical protein DSL92_05525 [Halomonas gudaonensis]
MHTSRVPKTWCSMLNHPNARIAVARGSRQLAPPCDRFAPWAYRVCNRRRASDHHARLLDHRPQSPPLVEDAQRHWLHRFHAAGFAVTAAYSRPGLRRRAVNNARSDYHSTCRAHRLVLNLGGGDEPGNPVRCTCRRTAHRPNQIFRISIDERQLPGLTTTIRQAFGSRIMADGGTGVPGGLLNNRLYDFFMPRDGEPLQPGDDRAQHESRAGVRLLTA